MNRIRVCSINLDDVMYLLEKFRQMMVLELEATETDIISVNMREKDEFTIDRCGLKFRYSRQEIVINHTYGHRHTLYGPHWTFWVEVFGYATVPDWRDQFLVPWQDRAVRLNDYKITGDELEFEKDILLAKLIYL